MAPSVTEQLTCQVNLTRRTLVPCRSAGTAPRGRPLAHRAAARQPGSIRKICADQSKYGEAYQGAAQSPAARIASNSEEILGAYAAEWIYAQILRRALRCANFARQVRKLMQLGAAPNRP